jgi:hypothetical protein
MWPGLASRLSRVLVGCHPRRWRERYREEMLDVLDQHQASARTVLNLAASVLSAHADLAHRAERPARIRLSAGEKPVIAVAAGMLAILTVIFIGAWHDRWHLSGAGGVGGVAFAPGQHLLVSAVGGASQDSMDTMWDVTDGRILASVTGTDQVAVWNVTAPARAARIATLTGPRDFAQAITLSPRGNLLAGVTYNGTVLVFSLADPVRPALTATISGIMADALYPDGQLQHPYAPPCPSCSPANYAVAFTPDGRTLTVVVARQEGNVTSAYSIAARDTVFTWNVTSSGAVSGPTIVTRNGEDSQPTLAPDGRTVADGSPTSNAVYLWTPP